MEIKYSDWTFDGRDEYLRRPIAEKVIRLLQSKIQVSPMAIDGDWGTGKTEFCHKLINLIKEGDSNCRAIYVDAFKADHADEPLLTLLAEVLRLVPEAKRDGVIKKILPAVRFGLKTGLKAGVSHLLRQDTAEVVESFEREVKQIADKSIDAAVETLLKDHIKASENLETLKSTLRELAEDALIFIFVDELDRCRPDFSVAMLETIKHVFDVKNVKFVLVTNIDQLRASINHRYGSSVDAQRYLDKFLRFTFTLSAKISPDDEAAIPTSAAHYKLLIGKSPLLSDTRLGQGMALEFVISLVQANELSMREMETFVRYLEIYHTLTDKQGLRHDVCIEYILLRMYAIFVFFYSPDYALCLTYGKPIDARQFSSLLGKQRLEILDGASGRPKSADILVAVIGREAQENIESFTAATDEQRAAWDKWIGIYFEGEICTPLAGQCMSIMNKAINAVSLCGNTYPWSLRLSLS